MLYMHSVKKKLHQLNNFVVFFQASVQQFSLHRI
jgi:hypothetical protein